MTTAAAVAASVKARRQRAPALFWSRVNKTETCWHWTGATFHNGYGRVKFRGRDTVAHRITYELEHGPIPAGLTLDHLCRVRPCVRPDHMEAVTLGVNVLRGETITRRNAEKTACDQGHPLSGANLFVRRDGRRRCRTCERASQKRQRVTPKYRAKHAEEERRRRAARRSAA